MPTRRMIQHAVHEQREVLHQAAHRYGSSSCQYGNQNASPQRKLGSRFGSHEAGCQLSLA
jgi:hypothetical protein